MKILFLSDNFPPEVNAPANRTFEHCTEWVKKGVEVTVITCVPNFPQGKVHNGYKNKLYQVHYINGIRVIRVWSYIAPNNGVIKRTLDYLSFALTSFFASFFVKADLIVATSPQFFVACSGFLVSLVKRRPWVMEVRDLWPESIKAVKAIQGGIALKWLEKLELFLYHKANRIVVVTDSFKENISSRGISAEKIAIVKNGVRLDMFKPCRKDENLARQLGLMDKFVIGYIGTHGMAHGLDFILKAVKGLTPEIHFLFIGDGAEKKKLERLKEELSLDNVTMHPPVPKEYIQKYLSIIDVALVPLRKSDTFKTVIPSKIFENAAMEKPILLGVEGEARQIVTSYQAGLCFEPENEASFLDKVMVMYSAKQKYHQMQQGCRNLANDFDRKVLAEKMLIEIIKAVSVKSGLLGWKTPLLHRWKVNE